MICRRSRIAAASGRRQAAGAGGGQWLGGVARDVSHCGGHGAERRAGGHKRRRRGQARTSNGGWRRRVGEDGSQLTPTQIDVSESCAARTSPDCSLRRLSRRSCRRLGCTCLPRPARPPVVEKKTRLTLEGLLADWVCVRIDVRGARRECTWEINKLSKPPGRLVPCCLGVPAHRAGGHLAQADRQDRRLPPRERERASCPGACTRRQIHRNAKSRCQMGRRL